MAKNEGKLFEQDWQNSCPDACWMYRLRDSAGAFSGNSNLRFASENICDYIMFDDLSKNLFLFELKSTQGTSLSFWRKDFENGKKKTYMIKKNQILGLQDAAKHELFAGFVINFRSCENRTFFIAINDFLRFSNDTDKKSINMNDVIEYGGIEIVNTKLRTRHRYNINELINDLK